MSALHRNHVRVLGAGPATLMFAHGFGCHQGMWRHLVPGLQGRFRIVLLDLVGMGGSDITAYDRVRHASLHGHAEDMLEVAQAVGDSPLVFVGHSVGATIGLLADVKAPGRFAGQIMVSPSPCYIDDGQYVGGFTRRDIDSLLETLDDNYLAWAGAMAPAIAGAPDQPAVGAELTNSFCRTDPDIARHFARVTFLCDHRAELPALRTPTLIVQSSDDLIAPRVVGEYMARVVPDATLAVVDNVGHCPHLSAPAATGAAIDAFLAARFPRA